MKGRGHRKDAKSARSSASPKTSAASRQPAHHEAVLELQRTIGNRAVTALVGRPAASAPFEQEADRVAHDVVNRPAPEVPETAERVPLKASRATPTSAPTPRGGRPLDDGARRFMEARLGHDLSAVRIATDDRAQRMARSLDARAFTVGHDIAFAEGQYQPSTHSGRMLLAHELAHVIQQAGGRAPPGQSPVALRSPPTVARQDAGEFPFEGRVTTQNEGLMAYATVEAAGRRSRAPDDIRGALAPSSPVIVLRLDQGGHYALVDGVSKDGTPIRSAWVDKGYIAKGSATKPGPEDAGAESATSEDTHGLSPVAYQRRKGHMRKAGGRMLEGVVRREQKSEGVAGGAGRLPNLTVAQASAFGLTIRTYLNSVTLFKWPTFNHLLSFTDLYIAELDKRGRTRTAAIIRAYRDGLVEEHEAAELRVSGADAEASARELDRQIGMIQAPTTTGHLETPLPPSLRYMPMGQFGKLAFEYGKPIIQAVDIAVDFVPVVGQLKMGLEAITGRTLSGQIELALQNPTADELPPDLEGWERALVGGLVLIPAAGRILRLGARGGRALLQISSRTGMSIAKVRQVLERAAAMRARIPKIRAALARLRRIRAGRNASKTAPDLDRLAKEYLEAHALERASKKELGTSFDELRDAWNRVISEMRSDVPEGALRMVIGPDIAHIPTPKSLRTLAEKLLNMGKVTRRRVLYRLRKRKFYQSLSREEKKKLNALIDDALHVLEHKDTAGKVASRWLPALDPSQAADIAEIALRRGDYVFKLGGIFETVAVRASHAKKVISGVTGRLARKAEGVYGNHDDVLVDSKGLITKVEEAKFFGAETIEALGKQARKNPNRFVDKGLGPGKYIQLKKHKATLDALTADPTLVAGSSISGVAKHVDYVVKLPKTAMTPQIQSAIEAMKNAFRAKLGIEVRFEFSKISTKDTQRVLDEIGKAIR